MSFFNRSCFDTIPALKLPLEYRKKVLIPFRRAFVLTEMDADIHLPQNGHTHCCHHRGIVMGSREKILMLIRMRL